MVSRIKVNELITMEIDFDNIKTMQQLQEINSYVNSLTRNITKYDVFTTLKKSHHKQTEESDEPVYKKKIKQYNNYNVLKVSSPFCNTREKVISCMKLHYFGTAEEKQKFFQKNDIPSSASFSTLIARLRLSLQITPKEVGMKKFPNHEDRRAPNFDIKKFKL